MTPYVSVLDNIINCYILKDASNFSNFTFKSQTLGPNSYVVQLPYRTYYNRECISTAFSKFDSYMYTEPNLSNKILNKEKLLFICREIKVVIKFVHRQNKALSDFSDQKVRPGVKPCFFFTTSK